MLLLLCCRSPQHLLSTPLVGILAISRELEASLADFATCAPPCCAPHAPILPADMRRTGACVLAEGQEEVGSSAQQSQVTLPLLSLPFRAF